MQELLDEIFSTRDTQVGRLLEAEEKEHEDEDKPEEKSSEDEHDPKMKELLDDIFQLPATTEAPATKHADHYHFDPRRALGETFSTRDTQVGRVLINAPVAKDARMAADKKSLRSRGRPDKTTVPQPVHHEI